MPSVSRMTAVLVGIVLVVVPTAPSRATFPGGLGQIVFEQSVPGPDGLPEYDVFVMNSDGSAVRDLTDAAFYQGSPAWSPDGRRVAFTSYSGIFVMDAASRRLQLVTRNRLGRHEPQMAYDVAWSPDGARLTYSWITYFPPGDATDGVDDSIASASIKVIDLDGDNARTIVPSSTGVNMQPVWSPDGKTIAFVRFSPGYRYSSQADIYRVQPDGRGLKAILTSGWNDYPSWTRDGRLLFRSTDNCLPVYVCSELLSTDRNGNDLQRLTQWPHDWTGEGEPDYLEQAKPSADGTKLLVRLQPYHRGYMMANPWQLWMWDLATGEKQLLIENADWIGNFDFAPACTVEGTPRPELLEGTSGPDLICGLGGDDVIRGLGGNDVIFGHGGDDRILGGSGADIVVGNAGRDRCDRDESDHSRVC